MQKSESIIKLSSALLQFNKLAEKVIKKADNPFFKSKYADLPSILDSIHPHLLACNLVISQIPDGEGLTTVIMHTESGEWISGNSTMKPVKNDPQSIGSAITYHRRYAICAMLNLNVDEDDDGNQASTPKTTEPKQTEPQKAWLNKMDKQGNLTKEYLNALQAMKEKGKTIANIRQVYAINKDTAASLERDAKL